MTADELFLWLDIPEWAMPYMPLNPTEPPRFYTVARNDSPRVPSLEQPSVFFEIPVYIEGYTSVVSRRLSEERKQFYVLVQVHSPTHRRWGLGVKNISIFLELFYRRTDAASDMGNRAVPTSFNIEHTYLEPFHQKRNLRADKFGPYLRRIHNKLSRHRFVLR